MTVRFKCQSEYQKSYRVSRSRSVSPQRCAPLAGLRSDQMGISREPGLQRRRRLGPGGLAQSCGSLLCPPDPQPAAHRTAPPAAALRSRSAHRREPSLETNPPTPPGARADPGPPAGPRPAAEPGPPAGPRPAAEPGPPAGPRPAAEPGPPAGPRPAAEPGPPAGPRPAAEPGPPAGPRPAAEPGPPAGPRPAAEPGLSEPGASLKSAKPRPSKHDSQPQLSRPGTAAAAAADGQQPSANEVEQHALRWRAGLRAGLRAGGQGSEYHRQFGWKKPATAASPLLTAEQVFRSSSRSVPPFKKHPVPMETEYRRSFLGLVPPAEPRLRKHLEHHQRAPLFHTHRQTNKKRREESERKPRPDHDGHAHLTDEATPPPPPQVQRGHRMLTEYESSFRSPLYRIAEGGGATDGDALQAKALRQQALSYRRRAWGANFSRDHLSQLLSEHNALWEATDTTDSATDPPATPPRLTFDLCRGPDGRSTPPVEALDLTSRSSSSSKKSSGNKNTQTPPSPAAAERRTSAWGEEEEDTDEEEEGRLPTPRLKIRPVQRTHHDLTTPATGGAILVGKLKNSDESSPYRQRCASAVSMAAGAEPAVNMAVKLKEAWSENNPSSSGSSPDNKPATSPASKPIRTKHASPSPVAPPPLVPPPQHCIQGTLRHADFQHNGDLGLRFRELQSSGGSDEDDRLSVMSWRSAASCSMASGVLERAQKRREDFWGKR